jgi:signal peptidase II
MTDSHDADATATSADSAHAPASPRASGNDTAPTANAAAGGNDSTSTAPASSASPASSAEAATAPAAKGVPLTPQLPSLPAAIGLFTALAGGSIWADLKTKAWAVAHLEQNGFRLPPKEIMKNRIWLVLARNPGGAWGMLHEQPEKIRKPFFVAVSLIALVVIGAMYRKLDRRQHALRWGLPLVFGGAIGNLVDRIRYGQVVDFIDVVYWRNKAGIDMHWPTFNVADIAICIGVILMAYDFLFPFKQPTRRAPTSSATPKPSSAAP